jgi:hypothetical protein
MTDQQNTQLRPRIENLSAYFLERANYYRLAAAMKTDPREIERLCEVAYMFERMAHDTRGSNVRSRLTARAWSRRQCSPGADGKTAFVKTWADGFVRLSRFICHGHK